MQGLLCIYLQHIMAWRCPSKTFVLKGLATSLECYWEVTGGTWTRQGLVPGHQITMGWVWKGHRDLPLGCYVVKRPLSTCCCHGPTDQSKKCRHTKTLKTEPGVFQVSMIVSDAVITGIEVSLGLVKAPRMQCITWPITQYYFPRPCSFKTKMKPKLNVH